MAGNQTDPAESKKEDAYKDSFTKFHLIILVVAAAVLSGIVSMLYDYLSFGDAICAHQAADLATPDVNTQKPPSFPLFSSFCKSVSTIIFSIATGFIGSAFLLLSYELITKKINELIQRKTTIQTISDQISEKVDAHIDRHMTKLHALLGGMTPVKAYEQSNEPVGNFRKDFVSRCQKSKTYEVRGVGATFTTYRLKKHINSDYLRNKEKIVLHLLDPRQKKLLDAFAKKEAGRSAFPKTVSDIVKNTKDSIYASIYAAYELRSYKDITIILHKDSPFYRAEFFDDCVFLSFYLGGEYPGSFLYEKGSILYESFKKSLAICTENNDLEKITMTDSMNEKDFFEFLARIECSVDQIALDDGNAETSLISSLENLRDKIFAELENRLSKKYSDSPF